MKPTALYIFIAAAGLLAVVSLTMVVTRIKTGTDTDKITFPSIDDIPKEYWTKLASKKIFFGHQSVGYNIIDGIKDIINERDYIKLNVVETCQAAAFDQPVFAHSQVGMNTKPFSKIKSFNQVMDSGVGSNVDIAFFKFCYVDITRDSDPSKIFDGYSAALKELKDSHPGTTFLHVTVPIRSAPKGITRNLKQSVKSIIGKPGFLEDNLMRRSYNELMRKAYAETAVFFDLALVESVNADSYKCHVLKGAQKVCVTAPEYTEDGGHLNSLGRKKAAEQLLIILAGIAGRSQALSGVSLSSYS
jgi:hypothetical protein